MRWLMRHIRSWLTRAEPQPVPDRRQDHVTRRDVEREMTASRVFGDIDAMRRELNILDTEIRANIARKREAHE